MTTSAYLRAANQPPPLEGYDLFSQDAALVEALRREGAATREEEALEPRDVQRIGLSATQRPLERIGRFLVGPRREVEIVDAGRSKELDLKIHVPVEDMSAPAAGATPAPGRGEDKPGDGVPADLSGGSQNGDHGVIPSTMSIRWLKTVGT